MLEAHKFNLKTHFFHPPFAVLVLGFAFIYLKAYATVSPEVTVSRAEEQILCFWLWDCVLFTSF